ncbi:MAG: nuclease domain-containing protein [Enterovibrio sp.]
MMKSIDIRYLDIMWNSDRSVLKVEESDQPIELEKINQHWQGDSITYPKKYFYIGICITDNIIYEPYLKLSNNKSSPLMPIKVPGVDKTWWIQKGEWDHKRNKYLASLYHTAGRVEISVQNETVILDNHTVNFSVSDLEYYLSDLKGKLWMLMLDNKSASKVSIQKETPSVFSDDVIKIFGDLASSFEAIVKKPHISLSEIQEKLPKRSVKPVTKTFREIATHPSIKLLTSRSYKESYNTPENRFIHHLATRALFLLKVLDRVASHRSNAMRASIDRDERWLREESKKQTKTVDPIVFDNEIQAITLDLEKQRQSLHRAAQTTHYTPESLVVQTYTISLGSSYGSSTTRYFVRLLNGQDFKETYDTYLVFSSCINFNETLNTEYLGPYEFRISGLVSKSKKSNNKGNVYYELLFAQIHSIEIIRSPLEKELSRLQATRENLLNNNWVAMLSPDELEVVRNQDQIAHSRLNVAEGVLAQLDEFVSHIPSLISRVKKSIQFFQMHNVKRQQEIPNSMVFLQNPLYSSAKSLYKKASNLEGMDDSLLNSMMAIDEIGLINLPNLYERWCLLQLIIVISDIYRFQIQDNWQKKLIDAVLKNEKNIEINFSCEARQLSLKLTYEKELTSGKRPDYVIDLYWKRYAHHSQNDTCSDTQLAPVQWYIDKEKVQRMVLDAKFRGNVNEGHINGLIDELYDSKNYSENGANSVFIVHPVAQITSERTSPLGWGRYCNYGHADETNHKKGAVYLSPCREHSNSFDNLQRLVGMLIQNHTSILDDGQRKNVIWHNKSCISCGSRDLSIFLSQTQGRNNVNKIHCKQCGQRTTETQCLSCERPLYKNGKDWTYHRTRAEQTTNVVCPQCETFL